MVLVEGGSGCGVRDPYLYVHALPRATAPCGGNIGLSAAAAWSSQSQSVRDIDTDPGCRFPSMVPSIHGNKQAMPCSESRHLSIAEHRTDNLSKFFLESCLNPVPSNLISAPSPWLASCESCSTHSRLQTSCPLVLKSPSWQQNFPPIRDITDHLAVFSVSTERTESEIQAKVVSSIQAWPTGEEKRNNPQATRKPNDRHDV